MDRTSSRLAVAVFSQGLARKLIFEQRLGKQLFETAILSLEGLQSLGVRYVHASEFVPSGVLAAFGKIGPAAELLNQRPRLRLLQEKNGTLFGVALLHVQSPDFG